VDVGFVKLTSYSSCRNSVFKMNIPFCCHLWCSSSVIFRNYPSQCTTISFCQYWLSALFLFADVVFPWLVHADITSETVAPDTPNNVAVWSQMLQLTEHQQSVLFKSRKCLPFSDSFTWTLLTTITNALARTLRSVNNRKNNN
jgi:hypothetical protein